jgi:hypothetical protein
VVANACLTDLRIVYSTYATAPLVIISTRVYMQSITYWYTGDITVVNIANCCCIQVLDQENSKKFLQGSETDKFQFFLKATGMHETCNSVLHYCAFPVVMGGLS